jgi:hypothetical protein
MSPIWNNFIGAPVGRSRAPGTGGSKGTLRSGFYWLGGASESGDGPLVPLTHALAPDRGRSRTQNAVGRSSWVVAGYLVPRSSCIVGRATVFRQAGKLERGACARRSGVRRLGSRDTRGLPATPKQKRKVRH